ncbi:hypothetical protein [Dyadobacter sp. OTU695]|uniref:hypothetical protein n=1 Tax=Dyadobacter sp. OTU695 TaxID=3043860 RepID=UPI00313DA471
MKTFLGYLTFAALLALCYVEKINAEAAKSQAGGSGGQHITRRHGAVWTGQRLAATKWKQ